jgi:poly(beta-D-mannuronate) lyase
MIAEAKVRNPSASFFDVVARRDELRGMTTPRLKAAVAALPSCSPGVVPVPPQGRMIIPDYYLEGSHGPVNPAHATAGAPYVAMWKAVARAATRYVATGDSAEAVCLLSILGAWADAGALLNYTHEESRQAWFTVQWATAAAALALSVARGAPEVDPAQLDTVTAWLVKVAGHQLSQLPPNPGPGVTSARNNHAHWRGLMAAAVGVVADKDELFRRGLQAFVEAVANLDENGAWPLEMERHERALHYQSFALQPLILIAELAKRQQIDLYAVEPHGRSIHDAVHFLLRAIDDPTLTTHYTPEPQDLDSLKPGSAGHAWAEFYDRRFPGKGAAVLLTAPLFNSWLGGGATVYAAPAH